MRRVPGLLVLALLLLAGCTGMQGGRNTLGASPSEGAAVPNAPDGFEETPTGVEEVSAQGGAASAPASGTAGASAGTGAGASNGSPGTSEPGSSGAAAGGGSDPGPTSGPASGSKAPPASAPPGTATATPSPTSGPPVPVRSFQLVRLRGGENATLVGGTDTPPAFTCDPYWTHSLDVTARRLAYQPDRFPAVRDLRQDTVLVGEMPTFRDCPRPHGLSSFNGSLELILGHDLPRTLNVTSAAATLSGHGSVASGSSARFTYSRTLSFDSGTYRIDGWFRLEHLGTWSTAELVADPYVAHGTWGPH